MNKSFEADVQKEVRHLVLPYYFNFRHYVELELKGLIITMTNEMPKITHDLKSLWKVFSEKMDELKYNSEVVNDKVKEVNFVRVKNDIKIHMKQAYNILEEYVKEEPAADYYRFLFDTKFELSKILVELDFGYVDKLFRDMANEFKLINAKLHEIVYIYCTL